ncbi:hypothetical protein G6M89_07065 [Natronolimnobius sp. AArcel1]|uniref:hypothetical protein n=1 Tax=Natronolimnobius sp. AArcel1 TaxID=1679093 RepID=UPI0013EC7A21|nr:hypothetical protein [Natronolimnobius sp. AArcel1]NGM68770.1 hypothetical protein [Natronolimnobius sp. AArcel1]
MADRPEEPSGPLDIPTLEVLARRGASHPLVTDWTFQPDSLSPRVLELEVDHTQYPDEIVEVRLDVRWFVGGDYTVHYLEIRDDEETPWQCRWDRHPKPNAPRAHFHPPPDAESVDSSSLDSSHHLAVLFGVLEWVSDRLSDTHS